MLQGGGVVGEGGGRGWGGGGGGGEGEGGGGHALLSGYSVAIPLRRRPLGLNPLVEQGAGGGEGFSTNDNDSKGWTFKQNSLKKTTTQLFLEQWKPIKISESAMIEPVNVFLVTPV